MATFTGTLNSNEIFAALFNMIISQQVFTDNIASAGSELVDSARVDGTLYGDTKLYYSTDTLISVPWGNDEESENLLKTYRPSGPKCQAITLDTFRQISLTVDNYLSKRAWGSEGAFSSFNNVMLGWIGETKKIYDASTYNAYLGTAKSPVAAQNIEIDVTTETSGLTGEDKARVEAETIAQGIADLIVNITDLSRDYNDYGFLRAFNKDKLKFVYNAKIVNKITKRDLPSLYHKDIFDSFSSTLPARYFGNINTSEKTGDGATIRSLIEQELTGSDGKSYHVFAGELIPSVCKATANTSYTVDENMLCKIYYEGSVPFMSAFEAETSFFNPKSLTENKYLTWGHNTLAYLENYPFITVKIK